MPSHHCVLNGVVEYRVETESPPSLYAAVPPQHIPPFPRGNYYPHFVSTLCIAIHGCVCVSAYKMRPHLLYIIQ